MQTQKIFRNLRKTKHERQDMQNKNIYMESDKWSQTSNPYGKAFLDCDNKNLPFRMVKLKQKINSIPDIILGKFLF